MKATISLKQLRTNPREYVRLLQNGYAVGITEHRRTLVSASQVLDVSKPKPGDAREILRVIQSLPKLTVLDNTEPDTVKAVKKAKTEYLEQKCKRLSQK